MDVSTSANRVKEKTQCAVTKPDLQAAPHQCCCQNIPLGKGSVFVCAPLYSLSVFYMASHGMWVIVAGSRSWKIHRLNKGLKCALLIGSTSALLSFSAYSWLCYNREGWPVNNRLVKCASFLQWHFKLPVFLNWLNIYVTSPKPFRFWKEKN